MPHTTCCFIRPICTIIFPIALQTCFDTLTTGATELILLASFSSWGSWTKQNEQQKNKIKHKTKFKNKKINLKKNKSSYHNWIHQSHPYNRTFGHISNYHWCIPHCYNGTDWLGILLVELVQLNKKNIDLNWLSNRHLLKINYKKYAISFFKAL